MFHHKCVRGYNDPVGRVVEDVNGIRIKNLRHLVEVLRDCKDAYVTFGFAGDHAEVFVLNRQDMTAVTKEIMNDNAVPSTGSAELVALWEKGQDKKVSAQEEPNEAEKLFHVMEKKLAGAKNVKVEFEGSLKTANAEKKQKGTFLLADKNKARIELTLDVSGKPKPIKIVSDGKAVRYVGDQDSVLQREVSRDFNARIVSRLSQAGLVGLDLPPRRVDEPRLYDFEMAEPERMSDHEAQVIRYRFSQQNTPAMSVTLWLDAETHFPLKRVMTIEAGPRFEENYRITVGEKADDSEFDLSDKAE
jgi:outer membrane lipoprotein-sorting protein